MTPSTTPQQDSRDGCEVVNFGGNVRFTPRRYYVPATEGEVLEILDRCSHERIRVVGSRHSWSAAIVSRDIIIDLRRLNQVAISESASGETWATVGGGCQIKRILTELHTRSGATLPSLGLITEQTIAGAISTATHGSGRHSLSHYMDEIRTAAYDPERGRAKIYTWNDGDGLRAARCAVGCMGVILSARFRCVPQYLISEHIERCAGIDQVLAGEEAFPLQQFYLVPHLWGWFVQRRRAALDGRRSWYAGLYRVYWFLGLDVGLHLAIKLMVAVLKSRRLVRAFFHRLLSPFIIKNLKVVDRSDQTLVMEHELFKHLEIEIFVSARHVRRAAGFVQEVLAAFDSPTAGLSSQTVDDLRRIKMDQALCELRGTFTHHYVVTFRRILPDDTLISTTAHADEPWYSISFITYVEPRDQFLKMGTLLLKCMIPLFGARPHWGKFCPLSREEAAALYPQIAEFRAQCLRVDPNGVFRNDFVRNVLGFDEPVLSG